MIARLIVGILFLFIGFGTWFWIWWTFWLPFITWWCTNAHGCERIFVWFILIDIAWVMSIFIGLYLINTRNKKSRREKEMDGLKNSIQRLDNKSKYENESNFCENCRKSLKKTAKFCGGCGSPHS